MLRLQDVKAKPLVKRSGSVASTMSEASEGDDGWVTATCWAVPGRRWVWGCMGGWIADDS